MSTAASTSPARERQSCLTADSFNSLDKSDCDMRNIVCNFLQMLMRSWGRPCHSVSGLISEDPALSRRLSLLGDGDTSVIVLLVLFVLAVDLDASAGLPLAIFFHFLTRPLAEMEMLVSE